MDNATRKKLWNDVIGNKVGNPDDYSLQYQSSLTRYVKALSEINLGIVSFDPKKEKIAKDYLHLFLTDDLPMNLLNKFSTYFEVEHWPKVHDAIMQEGINSRDHTKFFKEKFSHIFRSEYTPKGNSAPSTDEQVDLFDVLFSESDFEDVTFQTMKEELHKAKQEIESLMEQVQVLTEDKAEVVEKLRKLKDTLNDELNSIVD